MPNRRSPDAAMSPHELQALRALGDGLSDVIADQHRDLLIRMGLGRLEGGGVLKITDAGARRLETETNHAPGSKSALDAPILPSP
jgi:hypothetical protein